MTPDRQRRALTTRRIVLLGPPASGKGTQGERLSRHLGVPHVSTGELLRRSIEEGGDPYGVGDTVAAGGLVPDEVIEDLTFAELVDGFILDGFPRSVEQASKLDAFLRERNRPLEVVVDFRVDEGVLAERSVRRGRSEHRADDTPEAFRRRLREYDAEIRPLRKHYAALLLPVDGSRSEGDVFERILEGLRAREASADA